MKKLLLGLVVGTLSLWGQITQIPAASGGGGSVSLTGGTGISVSPNPITGTGVITNTAPGASPAGAANCIQLTDGAFAFISGCLADNTKPALLGPPLSSAANNIVGTGVAIFNQIFTGNMDTGYGTSMVAEITQIDSTVTGGFFIGILNAGAGTNPGPSYGGESVLGFFGATNYTGTGAGANASMDAQLNFFGSGTISEAYDYQSDANTGLMGATNAIGTLGGFHANNPCGSLGSGPVTVVNCVGLKIDNISGGGTSNRAIETGLGDIVFGGFIPMAKAPVCIDTIGKLYAGQNSGIGAPCP